MTIGFTDAVANARLEAVRTAIDTPSGTPTLKLYTTARPANANTAVSSQTLLATFNLDATNVFAAAGSRAIAIDASPVLTATGVAAGTAVWFRMAAGDGTTICDGSVGTSGSDLNLNTTTISVGLAVEITGGSITEPA